MKRRLPLLIGGAMLAVVLLVVLVVVGFLNSARSSNEQHAAPGTAINSGTPISGAGLRTFQIVPAQSTASYSVNENLIIQNKPNNDAVGTTHSVEGSIRVRTSGQPLIAGMNVRVDLRTLQTDSPMRDNYVRRRALETDTYPYATFVSVSTQGLPASYSDGQIVHCQLTGNLTMHGKTNKAIFDMQGKVVGKSLTGTATSTIFMTDYGIQPPNLANIAIAQNKVLITLNITAQEG